MSIKLDTINIEISDEDIETLKDAGYTQNEIDEFIQSQNEETNIEEAYGHCACFNYCKYKYDSDKLPNLDKIVLDETEKFTSLLIDGKRIEFETPILYLPFGLDKYHNNWSLKLEVINTKCEGITKFIDFLSNLETFICEKLQINSDLLNSQIKKKNRDISFYSRIQSIFNKPICSIYDIRNNTNRPVNIYRFPEKMNVKLKLRIGNIWKIDNIYCFKHNVVFLKIV